MQAISKLFLDTNVLLDLVDKTRPSSKQTSQMVALAEANGISLCCSALSLVNLAYILRGQQKDIVRMAIYNFLEIFEVQDQSQEEIKAAFAISMDDFEDAFQWIAAKKCGASHVATGDKKFLSLKAVGMPIIESPNTITTFFSH